MENFRIFADSCSDLSTELRKEYDLDYFRMNIVVKGEQHRADLDWGEFSYDQLYDWIKDTSNHCKTTQVPAEEFETKIIECFEKGMDVLYIACSAKLTGSMNVFNLVTNELKEKYPNRRAVGVDSLCASMGEGMIAIEASKLRSQGKSIDEVVDWVVKNRNIVNQSCSVESLKYLKQAGRVSASSAFFGDIIGIKPIIISDAEGHNYAMEKVKGSKKAINRVFELAKERIDKNISDVVYLGQGKADEQVNILRDRLINELGVKVIDYKIGPIIGVSCGPGVYVIFCFGKEVEIVGPDA